MLDITIDSFYSFEIYYGEEEYDSSIFERQLEQLEMFSLWYSNLEEAGVRKVFIAYEDGQIVGFLTTNADNQAIAIEVLPDFRGQGVASQMLDVARCYCPERNENPEFWRRISLMREIMLEYNLDSLSEVKRYILSWRYTKIKNHIVVITVDSQNYVSFSVDSSVNYEEGYVSVALGGVIFRWLEKSFKEMLGELASKGVDKVYCYPVDNDGACQRRLRAYRKIGFISDVFSKDGRLVYYIG